MMRKKLHHVRETGETGAVTRKIMTIGAMNMRKKKL